MNLNELIRYQDRCLKVAAGAVIESRLTLGQSRWLGLTISPSPDPQILVRDLMSLRPLMTLPEDLGWYAACPGEEDGDPGAGERVVELQVISQDDRSEVWSGRFVARRDALMPMQIEWPRMGVDSASKLDLAIRVPADSGGAVFLAVSRMLKRGSFTSAIRGVGVEIGPGMTPQIIPADDVDVLYVDHRSKSDWQAAYAYKQHKWQEAAAAIPWERYRSGGALNLPVGDGELDFLFGSHVFEHLVNPIQHLQNWLAKLKPGGKIHMILPNGPASVDFRHAISTLPELLAEHHSGVLEPDVGRYARLFGAKAEQALAERRSVHVHFYDPGVLAELFRHAQDKLGVAAFAIHQQRNYRELFFTLTKA